MVDEDVVATKLERAHEYTNDLAEMRGIPKEEYVSDVVLQRAVERTLMNLIQSCIDLTQHVRAAKCQRVERRKTRFRYSVNWRSSLVTHSRRSRKPLGFEMFSHISTEKSTTT